MTVQFDDESELVPRDRDSLWLILAGITLCAFTAALIGLREIYASISG